MNVKICMNDARCGQLLVSVHTSLFCLIHMYNGFTNSPRCVVAGQCEENPKNMRKFCRKACDFCGIEEDIKDDEDYYDDDLYDDTDDEPIVKCKDTHELCSFWAEKGECLSNPSFMDTGCAVSCGTCI